MKVQNSDLNNVSVRAGKEFGFWFWLHLTVVILTWLSPFLFPWWLVQIGVAVYYMQLAYFGYCILTKAQFHTRVRKETFYGHYLARIGLPINQRKLILFNDYLVPWLLVGLAVAAQLWFGFVPFLIR